jgi:hypothetical protein
MKHLNSYLVSAMRKGCLIGVASLFVLAVAERASADVPQVVVPGKGHRYIVWLPPWVIHTGTKPPLTDADITRYCGAAQTFAEGIWRVTNGRHRIFQVEFNYGKKPARYDVLWSRYHGVPSAAGNSFWMYDMITGAGSTHTEKSLGKPDSPSFKETCDSESCIQTYCPPGLTIKETSNVHREICVDANGNSPLRRATTLGWYMVHEASHSHYNMPDEYFTDSSDPILYGFGICANPTDWNTSVMATRADYWCDKHTHLHKRFVGTGVDSPFVGTKTVAMQMKGGVWTQAKGMWADLASYNPGPAIDQARSAHGSRCQPTSSACSPGTSSPALCSTTW